MTIPWKSVGDFISRHAIWVALIVSALFMLAFKPDILWTIFYIILGEGLALSLSGLGQYAYTHIKFTKLLDNGTDPIVKLANAIILAAIFIGVHFLVGYSMYGIFLANKG